MKFLRLLLLTFTAFFGCNYLFASTAQDNEKYLTYWWSRDEDNLYLNIDLSKELNFADTYTTMKINNGLGCEVVSKPLQGGVVFSSEGYELQEIKFTVLLKNMEDPNQVAYTAITKSFYKTTNEQGRLVSRTSESRREAVLRHPAIDLTQKPDFFTIDEGWHEGMISFKNSFPYSQIQ